MRKATAFTGTCSTRMASATASPTANDLPRSWTTAVRSRRPRACDVIPLVPILRKPKTQ